MCSKYLSNLDRCRIIAADIGLIGAQHFHAVQGVACREFCLQSFVVRVWPLGVENTVAGANRGERTACGIAHTTLSFDAGSDLRSEL